MDIVRDGREGTDFTIQIVIVHLNAMIIALICARLGDSFGYATLFAAELAVAIISFLYVLKYTPYYSNTEIQPL